MENPFGEVAFLKRNICTLMVSSTSGHPFASLGNIPGMSLMANPDYQLAPAEPSSVSTTSPCHPDSTWTGTDSAIESIGPDEILQSSKCLISVSVTMDSLQKSCNPGLSPITQVQSPSASASSVQVWFVLSVLSNRHPIFMICLCLCV